MDRERIMRTVCTGLCAERSSAEGRISRKRSAHMCVRMAKGLDSCGHVSSSTFYAKMAEKQEKRAFFSTFAKKSAIFLQFCEIP